MFSLKIATLQNHKFVYKHFRKKKTKKKIKFSISLNTPPIVNLCKLNKFQQISTEIIKFIIYN